jgi:hypothetical protein
MKPVLTVETAEVGVMGQGGERWWTWGIRNVDGITLLADAGDESYDTEEDAREAGEAALAEMEQ